MFLRIAAAFIAACFLFAAEAASPAENFVQPVTSRVAISPSGKYVAVITAIGNGRKALAVAPFENGKIGKFKGTNLGDALVLDVIFKTDDRLVVTVLQRQMEVRGARDKDNQTILADRTLVLAMNRDGSDPKVMMPDNEMGVQVVSALRQDPQHILLSGRKSSYAVNLFLADISTGEVEKIEEGVTRKEGTSRKNAFAITQRYVVSATGVPYVRYDYNTGTRSIVVYGRPVGGPWTKLREFPVIFGAKQIEFGGLASDRTAYVIDRGGDDRRAVWEYDLTTGKSVRRVFADPAGEVDEVMSNVYTGELMGQMVMTAGKPKWAFTSGTFAATQAALEEAFPNYANITIRGYSQDLGTYVIHADGPSTPPVYFLFDGRNGLVSDRLAVLNVDASGMGPVKTVTWPSSDGRVITGYLALPASGSTNLPLIVMPHGGPESQDELNFDPWRQFLVSRGYAVFQPQFRGGDGFGAAHEKAAHGQWGKLVQDDVTTGVAKLVADGVADPKRMCIFGWSYGGYMAMAGAVFTPDLYNCSVAGAGLSDVDRMLAWEGEETSSDSQVFKYWIERMGDAPTRQAASPVDFVGNLKIPMLLIHGDRDENVPFEQSVIMRDALQKAGKDVTFVELPGEEHTPFGPAMIKTLNAIEAFLAKHING
jgi:dipeptidyl aminopeptidase/acylaminoacyl peptidase